MSDKTFIGKLPRWFKYLLALGACAVEPPAAASSSTAATSDSRTVMRTLIGDAACSSDTQCGTVGVGAKACGGPSAYLAWSSWRTDETALRAAAQIDSDTQRQQVRSSGRMSTCQVLTDPGAYCDFGAPAPSAAA